MIGKDKWFNQFEFR